MVSNPGGKGGRGSVGKTEGRGGKGLNKMEVFQEERPPEHCAPPGPTLVPGVKMVSTAFPAECRVLLPPPPLWLPSVLNAHLHHRVYCYPCHSELKRAAWSHSPHGVSRRDAGNQRVCSNHTNHPFWLPLPSPNCWSLWSLISLCVCIKYEGTSVLRVSQGTAYAPLCFATKPVLSSQPLRSKLAS